MSLVASLVAVCGLAVPLALAGQALAALVALTLGAAVLQVLLLWCVVPRRPGLRLRHGDWRAFAAHGLQAAGIQTAALVVASGDQWMVSRLGSADQLGQYNRATSLVQSPLQAAAGGLSSWLYPRFCRLPVGPQRSAAACSLLIALLAVVLVPVEVCALRAPGIAHLVLGSGWELVGTVLPACAVAAPAAVLGLWGSLLLWAEGRLGIENLVTWLVAMGLLLGWWLVAGQGMVAIAWVTCAGAWVRALGLAVPAISGRTVGGMRGAGRAMSLLVLVLVAEAAWLQVRNSPLTPSGQLVECITVTLVTWGACAVVLWRSGLLARIRADFQGVSLVADAPQG
jgi:O-antigen/teichoic acid export membrane protein